MALVLILVHICPTTLSKSLAFLSLSFPIHKIKGFFFKGNLCGIYSLKNLYLSIYSHKDSTFINHLEEK